MASKKLTSYQKLKRENQELLSDIYKLIGDSQIQNLTVRSKYLLKRDLERAYWFGGVKIVLKENRSIHSGIFDITKTLQ